MADTDLVERVRQYAAFLGDKIQAEKAIEMEESTAGSIAALQRLQAYRAVRDELYKLFPEIDFYGPLRVIAKEAAEFEDKYFQEHPDAPYPLIGRPTGKSEK